MSDAASPAQSTAPAGVPTSSAQKAALRRRLVGERMSMPDRETRVRRLQAEVGTWLARRPEQSVGAYWPIRGEPDLLPLLGTWRSGAPGRSVGLPVVDPATSRMAYRGWYPGVPMEDDAFGIPTPQGTPVVEPQLLLVPCVGFGPGGVRLGYGGGFFDRMLAGPGPLPLAVGIAFAGGYVADLVPAPHDVSLDVILTEDGVAWARGG